MDKVYSETAWGIASRYSSILASETRDLAAAIDEALMEERSRALAAIYRQCSNADAEILHEAIVGQEVK